MNGLRLAFEDIKHMWSSHILRKSVLGLMVLPLLYSFIYLWAFWNPTDLLHKLPLAVVNHDEGMRQGTTRVNLGKQLADKLTADEQTNWRLVSEAEAERGLSRMRYFAVLTIPRDFTRQAYSAGTPHPQHSRLSYKINEGANMLGAKIVRGVMDKVESELQKQLTTRYLGIIFDQILNGGQGLGQAADASEKLADGTMQAYDGAAALTNGLQQSGKAMDQLADGLTKLADGANELENGIIRLHTAVNLAAGGAGQIGGRLNESFAEINKLADTVSNVSDEIGAAASSLRADMDALSGSLRNVQDGLQQLDALRRDTLAPIRTVLQSGSADLDQPYPS